VLVRGFQSSNHHDPEQDAGSSGWKLPDDNSVWDAYRGSNNTIKYCLFLSKETTAVVLERRYTNQGFV
jgi:hypothetical protein